MSLERSLIIIKPDSVRKKNIGKIITEFEKREFTFLKLKVVLFDQDLAVKFYQEHVGKPFFKDLSEFITSGPCVVVVIEKENCILDARELIGSTDPQKASDGTIRKMFAESIDSNAIHGSDSLSSSQREISIFFDDLV